MSAAILRRFGFWRINEFFESDPIGAFRVKTVFMRVCKLSVVVAKVCGVDLRDASHEQAVEAIRRAGDTVTFLIQSGQDRPQVQHLS